MTSAPASTRTLSASTFPESIATIAALRPSVVAWLGFIPSCTKASTALASPQHVRLWMSGNDSPGPSRRLPRYTNSRTKGPDAAKWMGSNDLPVVAAAVLPRSAPLSSRKLRIPGWPCRDARCHRGIVSPLLSLPSPVGVVKVKSLMMGGRLGPFDVAQRL